MYKLKNVAKRGSALLGAAGLLVGIGASALPVLASANGLNPLTDRSLTLSSSSPGWSFTDGSGNSLYAPPNSGPNGKQSGNFYSFKPSTTGAVKAMTFQYCTLAAGNCEAPGNDGVTGSSRNGDDSSHSDLNVTYDGVVTGNGEIPSGTWTTLAANIASDTGPQIPNRDNSQGNFVVLVNGAYSGGWTMSVAPQEEGGTIAAGTETGKNNMITLVNASGASFTAGQTVQVKFYATDHNYITNPGAGYFFVKINDYDSATNNNPIANPTDIIDGGVTVANVMNQSIQIQTKVLETMQFSVGTVDPDTLVADNTTGSELHAATGNVAHGQCDPIQTGLTSSGPVNLLSLGNSSAEYSLETGNTYGAHSYWRLSSNSSAGATVYYSGNTLSDTENDHIAPIGATAAAPLRGTPQFGLAIDNVPFGTDPNEAVNHDNTQNTDPGGNHTVYDYGVDNGSANNGNLDSTATYGWNAVKASLSAHDPQLAPLQPTTNYGGGQGLFNQSLGALNAATKYAFDPNANTQPVAIATESSSVVDCVTAKMRYVANIAATTPAGIYTTKINYIAAPQY